MNNLTQNNALAFVNNQPSDEEQRYGKGQTPSPPPRKK